MTGIIANYIKGLAYYMVIMNVFLIIVPNKKYRGYIKTILGFLLIIYLIKPIGAIIKDLNQDNIDKFIIENNLKLNENEIKAGDKKYSELIFNEMKNDIREQINQIIKNENNNLEIKQIDIKYKTDNENIIGIDKIKIKVNQDYDFQKLKGLIADFYKIDNENIIINNRGDE